MSYDAITLWLILRLSNDLAASESEIARLRAVEDRLTAELTEKSKGDGWADQEVLRLRARVEELEAKKPRSRAKPRETPK